MEESENSGENITQNRVKALEEALARSNKKNSLKVLGALIGTIVGVMASLWGAHSMAESALSEIAKGLVSTAEQRLTVRIEESLKQADASLSAADGALREMIDRRRQSHKEAAEAATQEVRRLTAVLDAQSKSLQGRVDQLKVAAGEARRRADVLEERFERVESHVQEDLDRLRARAAGLKAKVANPLFRQKFDCFLGGGQARLSPSLKKVVRMPDGRQVQVVMWAVLSGSAPRVSCSLRDLHTAGVTSDFNAFYAVMTGLNSGDTVAHRNDRTVGSVSDYTQQGWLDLFEEWKQILPILLKDGYLLP